MPGKTYGSIVRRIRAAAEHALTQAKDTSNLLVGQGTLGSVDQAFAAAFGDRPAIIVADQRTYDVAGRSVVEHLSKNHRPLLDPVIFPAEPVLKPDYRYALELRSVFQSGNAIPIAVGSGTLNDLTKLAAHYADRPYMVVATAASMDGYTASGAALIHEGFKQTIGCPAPRAVIADVDILTKAPVEMTASGYADLVGKVTAGADWLVADALGIEPIHEPSWQLVRGSLWGTIAAPERLRLGDPEAVELLFLGLVITGLAMQAAGTSRPASGSEHQFSHLWEMKNVNHGGNPVSHGFKVGIGSLAVAALYEQILAADLTQLDFQAICEQWPTPAAMEASVQEFHERPNLLERTLQEVRAKYITAEALAQRLEIVRASWPDLRDRLQSHLVSASRLRELLAGAGCPTEPWEIGLTLPELRASYVTARQIRRRYTVLDFAAETGGLSPYVDPLFERHGYWGSRDRPGRIEVSLQAT